MLIGFVLFGISCLIAMATILIWDTDTSPNSSTLGIVGISALLIIIAAMTENIGVLIAGVCAGELICLIQLLVAVTRNTANKKSLIFPVIILPLMMIVVLTSGISIWSQQVTTTNTPQEITRIHKIKQEIQIPYGVKYFETEDGDTISAELLNDNRMKIKEFPHYPIINR